MDMKLTRNIVLALACLGLGQTAYAGSLDPVVEPVVIVEDKTASSGGPALVVALAILLSLPLFSD